MTRLKDFILKPSKLQLFINAQNGPTKVPSRVPAASLAKTSRQEVRSATASSCRPKNPRCGWNVQDHV